MLSSSFLRVAKAGFVRTIKTYQVSKSWMLNLLLLPPLWLSTSIFVYLMASNGEPSQGATLIVDYRSFLVLGTAVQILYFMVLWDMGMAIIREKNLRTIELIFVSPVDRTALFTGVLFANLLLACWTAVYVFLLGATIFQAHFTIPDLFTFIVTMMALLFGVYAFGLFLSTFFLGFARIWNLLANTLQEPIYFLSGVYFPVEILPLWLRYAAYCLPMTHGLELMRNVTLRGINLLDSLPHLLNLLVISTIYLVLGVFLLRSMEAMAKRKGELTFV